MSQSSIAPALAGRPELLVDLDALAANYRTLKAAAGANAAAVVKCNAYGMGVSPVARALADAGCKTFFVAHAFEGAQARAALGPGPTVFVLNGPAEGSEPLFFEAGLVPVLNSRDQIALWRAASKTTGRPSPAALHVDTGMNRLGLRMEEFTALIDDGGLDGVEIVHLMSHLACSSAPDDDMNATQRDAFAILRKRMPQVPASFAASAIGAFGPPYGFDLARLGIALYGASPYDAPAPVADLKTVATVRAPIVQLREALAGESVGYGADWRTGRRETLAVVACGYGDGYPRALSSRGRGFVNGVRVPVAGKVSMDLTTFEVTDAATDRLKPGDFIEMLGPNVPIEEVADLSATAPYEILTGLGVRLHRSYLSSGATDVE